MKERIIVANRKYFDNELKIIKNIAIELFEGKSIEFSIKVKFVTLRYQYVTIML